MPTFEELEEQYRRMMEQSSPLMALDPEKYEPMGYDDELQRWIVKSKTANRFYSLPGTEGEIRWTDPSKPIKATDVPDRFKQGEINIGNPTNIVNQPKKRKTKEVEPIGMSDVNPNYPLTAGWSKEPEYKIETDYDQVASDILKKYNVDTTKFLTDYLTTPISNRQYSGSQNPINMMDGKINYYYNPNSKTWRMGLQGGKTFGVRGVDVPTDVWNKAGLVKPEKDIVASYGVPDLDSFQGIIKEQYQTYQDARNFGLDIPFDKQSAKWFNPDEQTQVSPSGITYVKDPSGGWIAGGQKVNETWGKNIMYLNPEYNPIEFESDMARRKGWVSPGVSGVNAWQNEYGQLSITDPAQLKVEDYYRIQESKKRNKPKGNN